MASGGSQAGAYAALIGGGVLVVAGFSGHAIKDVLAGKSSPLKGLISEPPQGSEGGSGNTSASAFTQDGGAGRTSAAVSGTIGGAIEWAKGVVGTSGGSGAVARWDAAIGDAPGIPWCSAFVSAILRHAGIKNLPADAAYSGAWEGWSGGTKLPVTSTTINEAGNLLIFDWGDGGRRDHVAYGLGGGQQIQGNDENDSVGISPISATASNIVAVIKPKYPAKNARTTSTKGFRASRV